MKKIRTWLDQYFEISENQSNLTIEYRAAITTFLTMLYILIVNPTILAQGIQIPGVDLFPEFMTATAIVTAIGCLCMALWANYPFAVAPGMGMNAFFIYAVVLGLGMPWQTGLASIFMAGLLFTIVTLTGIRTAIVHAIPDCISKATAAGIGLFLGLVGLTSSKIVIPHATTLVSIGHLTEAGPLLTFAGLAITGALLVRRVPGAILIGIICITLIAVLGKLPVFHGHVFEGLTTSILQLPRWPTHLFLAFDLKNIFNFSFVAVVFSFFFVGIFDTFGAITALSARGRFVGRHGTLPRLKQAFMADATASVVAGMLGSSMSTPFIESAAGVAEGGRTGLTAILIGCLFLLALFFWPLATLIPSIAIAPALILIGAMTTSSAKEINWHNPRESVPAFLTLLGIPLTYSIPNGVALGMISYVTISVLIGEWRKISFTLYGLTIMLCLMLGFLHKGNVLQ